MVIIIFGLPGAGKTYVGKILAKYFQFVLYEGDTDIPNSMLLSLQESKPISDSERDLFFNKLIKKIKTLHSYHKNLVVSQTFIKDKYRKKLIEKIPDAHFILVEAKTAVREKRLANRKTFPITKAYAQQMESIFENPSIEYNKLDNTPEGEKEVKKQLKNILI